MCRLVPALAAAAAAAALVSAADGQDAARGRIDVAQFDDEGRLIYPTNLDEWVHLGSSVGMSYRADGPASTANSPFGVVTMEPTAWRWFKEHGEFADGTMFHLSFHGTVNDERLGGPGVATGPTIGREIHYKDSALYEGGFNFFLFGPDGAPAAAVPLPNDCVTCHTANGAYDGVFAQFYPDMLARLGDKAE